MSVNLTDLVQTCCQQAMTSVRLRQLLTLLLKELYTTPGNLDVDFESLDCLIQDTGGPSFPIGPAHVVGKDADTAIRIAVRRVEVDKRYIGNYAGTSEDGSTDIKAKHHIATCVVRHFHPAADVAMLMAENSLTFFEAVAEILLRNIPGLLEFECREIQEATTARPQPVAREYVDLVVVVRYQFLVAVKEESHLLKKIDLSLRPI